jgi:hypothetical protein
MVPLWGVIFFLKHYSTRLATIYKALGYRKDSCQMEPALAVNLDGIRRMEQPAWKDLQGDHWADYEEAADWLADDLLRYGLPVLERARTVEGIDWLHNQAPGFKDFFHKRRIDKNAFDFSFALRALVYAWLAGNPEFDALRRHVEECLNDDSVKSPYTFNIFKNPKERESEREEIAIFKDLCLTGRLPRTEKGAPA